MSESPFDESAFRKPGPDRLERMLASIEKDVPPSRDLWPSIAAALNEQQAPPAPRPARWLWLQLAAGVLLVVGSSVTTYLVMQRSQQRELLHARETAARQLLQAPAVPAMPASFGGTEQLSAGYVQARSALDAEFQRHVAALSPATRAKVENDLAELRRAAADIAATLELHPSHPLLQELLLSTYQSELALLSSVNEMASETRL